eukprot:3839761-Rhodomonas_salina.1
MQHPSLAALADHAQAFSFGNVQRTEAREAAAAAAAAARILGRRRMQETPTVHHHCHASTPTRGETAPFSPTAFV